LNDDPNYQYVEVPVQQPDDVLPTDPRFTYGENDTYNTWVHRALLCQTDYRQELIEAITKAPLFAETQRSLLSIVKGAFDKTVVLSRLPDPDVAHMRFEIIMLEAKQSFRPFEVESPEFVTLYNMILDHYGMFISRTLGGWERDLQNKIETSTNYQVSHTQKIAVPKEKKGFRIPFLE